MRVAVIGAGALGKAYGGLLALGGHEVHFLARSEFNAMKQVGEFALDFAELKQVFNIKNPNIHRSSSDLPISDLIIISVKTTANNELPSLLSSCRTDRSVILVLQNGINNEEYISQFTGQSPILCGISMMGAVRRSAIEVDIPILGRLRLAPFRAQYTTDLQRVTDAFSQSPVRLSIETSANHRDLRWQKLAWNIPFGALALMYGQTTSVLASEAPYLPIVEAIIDEIRAIARADGSVFHDDYVKQLLELTRRSPGYMPSTYVDYKAGRRLETEYIFKNILTIASERKVRAPLLNLIERYLTLLEMQPKP